jgi:hypothetical protein
MQNLLGILENVEVLLITLESLENVCELSFDPEVATLFGKEIGQSNGDILLTFC